MQPISTIKSNQSMQLIKTPINKEHQPFPVNKTLEKLCLERKQLDDEISNNTLGYVSCNNFLPVFEICEPIEFNICNKTNENEWPSLSIDNINTSFKVITDLQPGYKLKVVDKLYLAPDNSYFYMLRNPKNGAGRNVIISYLDHLYSETSFNINKILSNVNNINDEGYCKNIGVLTDLMHNLSTFVHHFGKIKEVYKTDSSTCARLDNIYKKYQNLHTIIFCQITGKKI